MKIKRGSETHKGKGNTYMFEAVVKAHLWRHPYNTQSTMSVYPSQICHRLMIEWMHDSLIMRDYPMMIMIEMMIMLDTELLLTNLLRGHCIDIVNRHVYQGEHHDRLTID
jgi:hypothetical protein